MLLPCWGMHWYMSHCRSCAHDFLPIDFFTIHNGWRVTPDLWVVMRIAETKAMLPVGFQDYVSLLGHAASNIPKWVIKNSQISMVWIDIWKHSILAGDLALDAGRTRKARQMDYYDVMVTGRSPFMKRGKSILGIRTPTASVDGFTHNLLVVDFSPGK